MGERIGAPGRVSEAEVGDGALGGRQGEEGGGEHGCLYAAVADR